MNSTVCDMKERNEGDEYIDKERRGTEKTKKATVKKNTVEGRETAGERKV